MERRPRPAERFLRPPARRTPMGSHRSTSQPTARLVLSRHRVCLGTPTAQFTLTNTAGNSTSIAPAGGSSQTAVINTQFTQSADGFGHRCLQQPCPGCDCHPCGANGTAATASLSASSAVTDTDGLAHVIATANGIASAPPYTVTATAGSVGIGELFSHEQYSSNDHIVGAAYTDGDVWQSD